jgi:hypothetical protein
LLAHLDTATPEGGLSEAGFARLGELVAQIRAHTVYPEPAKRADKLAGRWETLFAHFGARHSAGKPRVHESNLKIHSFNKFPELPISVRALQQVVSADGAHYDNIVSIATPQGGLRAEVVTSGTWVVNPANPLRLDIEFHRVELCPAAGVDATAQRAGRRAGSESQRGTQGFETVFRCGLSR